MAHIKIKKGLNIPLTGTPKVGEVKTIQSTEAALDFTPFAPTIQPRLLVNVGDMVCIGQPLIEEKGGTKRIWTSPASGVVKEIRRGQKRILHAVIIESTGEASFHPISALNPEEPIQFLQQAGLLSYLWMRPFCLPAHPDKKPRSIFVKAIESAPFTPSAELQLDGRGKQFQLGLNLLSSIVNGQLHLIHSRNSTAFHSFENVRLHTAEGPHPISNPSLHIQLLDPILTPKDSVWTIDVPGVIAIGQAIETGKLHPYRIISLAGNGILPEHQGYYRIADGADIQSIVSNRLSSQPSRLISGDPLNGMTTTLDSHIGYGHSVVCSILEEQKRSPLHFFRLKNRSFTSSGAYFQNANAQVSTRLHGEQRAFIDPNIYDRVMPLQIPTVPLIKALLTGDFETAEILGILEVAPEDFSLPTFICPSKIEMVDIVRNSLYKMASEL